MSQLSRVKAHLEQGWSLTPIEALAKFGCMRLAARVKELRDQGIPIRTTIVELNGRKVAKYSKGRK